MVSTGRRMSCAWPSRFLPDSNALVIGSRKFARKSPWRSRFGNQVTRQVFRWVAGVRLADTQSGLRCFPRTIAPRLLALAGERYEYEMNVLAACPKLSVPLREVEIETVYLDGNRSSHFNPVVDSVKIYSLLVRLSLSASLSRLRRACAADIAPPTILPEVRNGSGEAAQKGPGARRPTTGE